MPTSSPAWLVATLAVTLTVHHAHAETKVELVSTKLIWDQAPRNVAADVVRFNDRWFVVCAESTTAYSQDNALRVLTSADAIKWESTALLQSPTLNKGLYMPKFSRAPNGDLLIVAQGIIPTENVPEPIPKWGGTTKMMTWSSKDGRTWAGPQQAGEKDYPFASRTAWNRDVALLFAHGNICGNSTTIHFLTSKDGRQFKRVFEETLGGYFPEEAALVFAGEKAHCLMSRISAGEGSTPNVPLTGMHGTAPAPYTDWEWKTLDTKICYPNLLRLPDQRLIAAVGLTDQPARMVLADFDLASGKFTEFLTLPTGGKLMNVGLALHDEHLWVSYHALHQGKWCIYLAQVKLK